MKEPRRRGGSTSSLDAPGRDLHVEVQRVDHDGRIHLDIESDDLDAEVARLEAPRGPARREGGDVVGAGGAHRAAILRGAGEEGPGERAGRERLALRLGRGRRRARLSTAVYSCGVRSSSSLIALGAALASILSGRALTVAELPFPPPSWSPPKRRRWCPPPARLLPSPGQSALPAIRFVNTRTGAAATVRVYAADGAFDEEAAATIDRVAAERDAAPRPLDRRVIRLLVKAAAHFHATEVDLVSTFRDSARGGSRHRTGEAADFSLPGVPATKLAAHLQGVCPGRRSGVYTHPRTQFVHLDVRAESFHWAEPPRCPDGSGARRGSPTAPRPFATRAT